MTSQSDDNGHAEGPIDVEGGYTQAEQLAELEIVVQVMREHFGEDVAMIEGEPWTAEAHAREVAPRAAFEDHFHHVIQFNVAPDDLVTAYEVAAEIAEELGLSEDDGNSNGLTEHGEIFFGAGHEEGRIFVMTGESSELFDASYTARRSDDSSLREAAQAVSEHHDEGRGSDNPRQLEDIEGYDEATDGP